MIDPTRYKKSATTVTTKATHLLIVPIKIKIKKITIKNKNIANNTKLVLETCPNI